MELSSSGIGQKVHYLGLLPRTCLFFLRINNSFLWNFVKSGLMSGWGHCWRWSDKEEQWLGVRLDLGKRSTQQKALLQLMSCLEFCNFKFVFTYSKLFNCILIAGQHFYDDWLRTIAPLYVSIFLFLMVDPVRIGLILISSFIRNEKKDFTGRNEFSAL